MTTNEDPIERIEATLTHLPIVGWVFGAGSSDPIYDLLIAAGPLLVVLVRVVGRTVVSQALVFLYLVSFVGYLLYKFARR